MVKIYDSIPDSHVAWINKQHMFVVATAPLTGDGHVNVSPKGIQGTLHVVNNRRVWYEDLSGSGAETIAHLRENGRVTVMFCAYEGAARILRLYGRGTVHEFGTPEYDAFIPPAERHASSRAAIVIDVHRVTTSCGYAVPLYTFQAERSALTKWAEKMEERDRAFGAPVPFPGPAPHADPGVDVDVEGAAAVAFDTPEGARAYAPHGMKAWWAAWNQHSVDGLPALRGAHLSDIAPLAGREVRGEGEPPSDGSVVVLGNRVPKGERGPGGDRKGGLVLVLGNVLLPQGWAELVRMMWVFALGAVVASVYGQSLRAVAGRFEVQWL
ncbi:hypothetical protein C8Q79DRAFT_1003903 [Trametes meyenii]|nr:hypothetical protein C8Q79DRAFT_1003903 [Trametes meyenii]